MHALLGLYMSVHRLRFLCTILTGDLAGNGSHRSLSTGIMSLERDSSDGLWYASLLYATEYG